MIDTIVRNGRAISAKSLRGIGAAIGNAADDVVGKAGVFASKVGAGAKNAVGKAGSSIKNAATGMSDKVRNMRFNPNAIDTDTISQMRKLSNRNALAGTLIGGIGGAGLGGLTGVVTGADEDNQKAMTVAGAIGGGIIGGFTGKVLGGRMLVGKMGGGTVPPTGGGGIIPPSGGGPLVGDVIDSPSRVAGLIASNEATVAYAGISHTENLALPYMGELKGLPGDMPLANNGGIMVIR